MGDPVYNIGDKLRFAPDKCVLNHLRIQWEPVMQQSNPNNEPIEIIDRKVCPKPSLNDYCGSHCDGFSYCFKNFPNGNDEVGYCRVSTNFVPYDIVIPKPKKYQINNQKKSLE